MTPVTVPLLKQGRLIGRCWQPPIIKKKKLRGWAGWLLECNQPATVTQIAVAIQGSSLGDATGDAHGPQPVGIIWRFPRGRWGQSPSLSSTWLRRCVTLGQRSSLEEDPLVKQHTGQLSSRNKTSDCNLGPLPTKELELEYFLREQTATQGAEEGCDLPPEPSVENYEVWVEWQGHHMHKPDWWEEVVAIPQAEDPWKLTRKVQTSFEIPQVRCKALQTRNNNSAPLAAKCINRKAFLPVPDPVKPCQDYREGQPWKTLAYTQALQYWVEKANLPSPGGMYLLVRFVQELRWAMRLFTTFSDCAVLEGMTSNLGTPEEQATQPDTPLKSMGTLEGQATQPSTTPAEQTPTRPPSHWLNQLPNILTLHQTSKAPQRPPAPLAEPAAALPNKSSAQTACCELPGWTEIHPAHPVGHISMSLGDLRWCHQSKSSSQGSLMTAEGGTVARWAGGLKFQLILRLPNASTPDRGNIERPTCGGLTKDTTTGLLGDRWKNGWHPYEHHDNLIRVD